MSALRRLRTGGPAGNERLTAAIGLVLIGLLEPRLRAVRQMALAGLVALGVCLLFDGLVGPDAGRPPTPQISGFDPRFPLIQLAVAVAVAATGAFRHLDTTVLSSAEEMLEAMEHANDFGYAKPGD